MLVTYVFYFLFFFYLLSSMGQLVIFMGFFFLTSLSSMGQLVTMAGLDQTTMPFASGSSDNPYSNGNGKVGKNPYNHLQGSSDNFNKNNSSSSGNDGNDHNTTYANMPLASSAFVTSRQQQQQQRLPSNGDPDVSHSIAASFTEGNPLVIGSRTIGRGSTYDEESGKIG